MSKGGSQLIEWKIAPSRDSFCDFGRKLENLSFSYFRTTTQNSLGLVQFSTQKTENHHLISKSTYLTQKASPVCIICSLDWLSSRSHIWIVIKLTQVIPLKRHHLYADQSLRFLCNHRYGLHISERSHRII